MRIVLTLAVGVIIGYVANNKKDQTIDSLVNGADEFIIRLWNMGLGKSTDN